MHSKQDDACKIPQEKIRQNNLEELAMTNDKPNKQTNIICTCAGTSKEKIEQLITQGTNTLDAIASATGANTGCGSCDILILELLDKKTH